MKSLADLGIPNYTSESIVSLIYYYEISLDQRIDRIRNIIKKYQVQLYSVTIYEFETIWTFRKEGVEVLIGP